MIWGFLIWVFRFGLCALGFGMGYLYGICIMDHGICGMGYVIFGMRYEIWGMGYRV